MDTLYYLVLFDQLSSVLIAILGLIFYWNFDAPLKLLSIYYVITAAASLIGEVFAANLGTNIFVFHFYTIAEYVILGKVFVLLLKEYYAWQKVNLLYWSILVIIVSNSFFVQGFDQFNSISGTVVGFFLIVFSIVYFNHSLSNPNPTNQLNAVKWILSLIHISEPTRPY